MLLTRQLYCRVEREDDATVITISFFTMKHFYFFTKEELQ